MNFNFRLELSSLTYCICLSLTSLALVTSTRTQAQTIAALVPSDVTTQELLRQQDRQRAQRPAPSPDVRLGQPLTDGGKLPNTEAPCFVIKQIKLEGDAAQQFEWALDAVNFTNDGAPDPAVGQCLGGQGLSIALKRVQNVIVKKGFITTRVLAAPQDLNTGVLTLTLIAGRLRAVRFSEDSSAHINLWNAVPAQTGELLNLRDIEQSLENLKRSPTSEADFQITPSQGPDAQAGDSDLIISYKQKLPLRLNLAADDSGAKATGRYQGAVTISCDNCLGLSDLFYLTYNTGLNGGDPKQRGNWGGTLHYSIPFGYWQIGLTTSRSNYRQAVAGLNQTYVYAGESSNSELKLSHIVQRDAARKTTVSISGWQRTSKNFIDDTEVQAQRRRMAGLAFGLGYRQFIGEATLESNLHYRQGTGALNSLPAPEEVFSEGTSRPKIFTADATLTAPFKVADQKLRYIAAWRIQSNQTPLVPQDRFAIGGRYTVRGFDGENLLSAERGWLLRNDLGLFLGDSGQELYLGVDYGQVGGPSSDLLVGKHLAGAVLGLRGAVKNISYDIFFGAPISKADAFQTSTRVAGFSLNWGF